MLKQLHVQSVLSSFQFDTIEIRGVLGIDLLVESEHILKLICIAIIIVSEESCVKIWSVGTLLCFDGRLSVQQSLESIDLTQGV